MPECAESLITIPEFSALKPIFHGFGQKEWTEDCFSRIDELKNLQPVVLKQIHSDTIHTIEGVPEKKLEGDALITCVPGLVLVVRTADCLPVLLTEKDGKAVAAVHCGWRGTEARILEKAVQKLLDKSGCRPESLLAALGPCIGPECYEVGEEVLQSFLDSGLPRESFQPASENPGKYILDLKGANTLQLKNAGLRTNQIFQADGCTHCLSSLLSYRRNRDEHSRLLNFIAIQ
ncbi:peptidoglycan editing factor PgeF [Acidobacteriota bacterium]